MEWEGLAMISAGEESDGYYPLLDAGLNVVPEPEDGTFGEASFRAQSAQVEYFLGDGGWATASNFNGIDLLIIPTASRMILQSRGRLGAGLTERDESQHSSALLVGHVRWSWIMSIGFQEKTFFHAPTVGVVVMDSPSDDESTVLRVSFSFGLNSAAEAFRDSIVMNSRSYHSAARGSLADADRQAWDNFNPDSEWELVGRRFHWLDMPSSTCIGRPVPSAVSAQKVAEEPPIPPLPPYPPPPLPPLP